MQIIKTIQKKTVKIISVKIISAAIIILISAVSAQRVYAGNDTVSTAAGGSLQSGTEYVQAEEMAVNIVPADNGPTARIQDGSYSTAIIFSKDNPVTITPADAADKIYGLYIIWAAIPKRWTLELDDRTVTGGADSFLHEYIAIPGGSSRAVINLSRQEKICGIKAYSEGELPSDVQVWKPSCDKADIMLLSTHADDEILFFGGILPEYAGERGLNVQLVYFSNYFGGTVIREHEKLDGLWTAGVRNYPVNGDFPDEYADDLEAAKRLYNYDKTLEFVVAQIRRFKPQICIAQDTNGEYGHGTHMLTSAAMQEAVTISMDESRMPESAKQYGVWDVPKTYIHLYQENEINLDCRKPLSGFGGKTAFEVAQESYKQHVSQQWCWFYVSDTNQYSIAKFGLYRTTAGADTGSDMMENLVSYSEQQRIEDEKIKAQEESKKAQEAYEEARKREEASRERAEYEHWYGVPKGESDSDKVSDFLKRAGITIAGMIGFSIILLFIGAFVHKTFIRIKRRKNSRHNKRRKR